MLLETLIKDIRYLLNSSEIKYTKIAKKYETVDSLRDADMYINAVMETDSFDGYPNFSIDILEKVGMTLGSEYDPFELSNNKYEIPYSMRDAVIREQRKEIIENYVEKNNYYRMLNGLPDIEEEPNEYIKLTKDELSKYNIEINVDYIYIHECSNEIIYTLNKAGFIDKIIEENPDKKYLKYLGENKISIVTARQANNFSIIKIGKDVPDEFYNEFLTIYEQNRQYFMVALFIQDYSAKYDMYDNFIALCIMIMTIQRVVSTTFKMGIQRDFYDWTFIQNMYKMYNVPFIEDLPIEKHVTLVKNLNNLLRYKSTDKVLFDICSLLGYERMNIFKYYLVKQHKLDPDGNPIFKYIESKDEQGNTILDEQGNPVLIEDRDAMYELYFQSVNVNERNTVLAMLNNTNKLDYDEVTSNDPYWWEDSDLDNAKYANDFNFVETKYLSLNLMYKMTEMLFEITYAFNMLISKKDELVNYTLDLPKLYQEQDAQFKIFDVVVFLIAVVCKLNGFAGNINSTSSQISHIYGFNFNEDELTAIHKFIDDNADKLEKDGDGKPIIKKYFNDLSITKPEHVNSLYEKIREYNDYIVEKMYTATDIEEYRIYKRIFNISMSTDAQNNMFKIKKLDDNGDMVEQTADTYAEYLQYNDDKLYTILVNLETSELNGAIEHTIFKINELITSLQYLYIINDSQNPAFTALIKLLRFFKSYTTDLTGFNIVYLFDSKHYNAIKIIDDINYIEKVIHPSTNMRQDYSDIIKSISISIDGNSDKLSIIDRYKYFLKIYLKDKYTDNNVEVPIIDYIMAISKKSMIQEYFNSRLKDNITTEKDINISSYSSYIDNIIMSIFINSKDELKQDDDIDDICKYIQSNHQLSAEDKLSYISKKLLTNDEIKYSENLLFTILSKVYTNILLKEKSHIKSTVLQNDIIDFEYCDDINDMNNSLYINNMKSMRDKLFIIWDS